jgi:colicin import membrane protein
MASKANAADYTTTRADSAVGPRLQLADRVPSPRRPRRSARSPTGPPDLGALAKDAVVSFLHDATVGTAGSEAAPAGAAVTDAEAGTTAAAGNAAGDGARDASSRHAAASAAWRAADASVAALDRIELAAAKIAADIAAAYRAQADLQAKAGIAAEAAVHAAQSAWVASVSATEAAGQSKIILRRIGQYLAVTITLVVISIIVLLVTAGGAY